MATPFGRKIELRHEHKRLQAVIIGYVVVARDGEGWLVTPTDARPPEHNWTPSEMQLRCMLDPEAAFKQMIDPNAPIDPIGALGLLRGDISRDTLDLHVTP